MMKSGDEMVKKNKLLLQCNVLQANGWLGMLFLICAVVLSVTACETMPKPDPTQAPADGGGEVRPTLPPPLTTSPFEEGSVVAHNNTVYRKFIGLSDSGGYVVQDFYIDLDLPRTDPYVMTRLEEVDALLFEETGQVVPQYRQLTESGIGIDGSYVQWYRSGGKVIEGLFERSFPAGPWTLVYESGHPMLQDIWRDGMRNGVSKGWHENGNPAGAGEYMDNLRQGVWVVWYPNGIKMQEGMYNNGQQDGSWMFWFENGNKKEAGAYVNGVRIGMWSWWTRDGVLAREAEYDETGRLKGTAMGSGRIQPREPTLE